MFRWKVPPSSYRTFQPLKVKAVVVCIVLAVISLHVVVWSWQTFSQELDGYKRVRERDAAEI